MLRQRILTAIVLLLIVAAAVTASMPWPMLALLGLMTGCALWEWLRLVQDDAAVRWGGAVLAVLVLVPLVSILTFLDRMSIAVVGTAIQQEFAIGPEGWGLILTAFVIAYSVFEIPSGVLGDRYGARR